MEFVKILIKKFAVKQLLNLLAPEFMHYSHKNEGNSTRNLKEDKELIKIIKGVMQEQSSMLGVTL